MSNTIGDIIKEWVDLNEPNVDLLPLITYYNTKYKGVEILDYVIKEDSIFITPKREVESIKITFKVNK